MTVAPKLKKTSKRRRHHTRKFRVAVVWVERRFRPARFSRFSAARALGGFETVAKSTALSGSFAGGKRKTVWSYRVRVRDEAEAARAADFSPVVTIKA